MKEQLKRIRTAVTIFCLSAGLFAAAWAEDPVVVRVGDFSYTKSQIESAISIETEMTELLSNQTLTEEEKQTRQEAAVERFVRLGLIQCKLQEKGQNDFTPEEEENLKAAARSLYEQLWQGIWQQASQSDEGFTEEQVTEYLEESGYSPEAIFQEYINQERQYRAIDLYCPALTLTEDMVQTYYESQYLNPDRERYEYDIALYEEEIIARQNESFYTPAGYRAIQQILIEYPDEVNKGLAREKVQFSAAAQEVADALQALAEDALTAQGWDDISASCAGYAEAAQAMEELQKTILEKRKTLTMPMIQTQLDEISAAFQEGADFSSLISQYSADTSDQNTKKGGYPVHPDSPNWSAEFLQAVTGLEKPGDISQPVLTDLGIHILYYASDIPAGEHVLTSEEKEALNASALYYYQNLVLDELLADWRGEYPVEIHRELLED